MRKLKSGLCFCLVLASVVSFGRPILQPEVKEYRATGGSFEAVKMPVFYQDQRQCEIAALEAKTSGGVAVWDGVSLTANGVYIAVMDSDDGKSLVKMFGLDVPARPQGYAIVAKDGRVAIVGHDPVGALYGAVTYAQMSVDGTCANAVIRDWPDYPYRGGLSIGRGLYYLGNGDKDRSEGVKAGLDMMLRMKLNMVEDYFWVKDNSDEKTFAFWRELTRYAEDRGIYPEQTRFIGVYDRQTPPPGLKHFKDWPCVKTHKNWNDYYYCWADDALTEQAANRYADYYEKLGFDRAHFYLHPVDGGSWQDPESWSKRCEKCRARWNDHERWKASVNQYNIYTRVFKKRFPNSTIVSSVYPYTFLALMTPEEKRTAKWRESMPEYWQHVDQGLSDKAFTFSSWIYTEENLKEIRKLLPTRPFSVSLPYPDSAGIFATFHRKMGSAWEDGISNRIQLRGSDSKPKWESVALFAEYAWNVRAPGAEPYDGSTFYDPLVDHTGPKAVIDSHLYRICFAYWGKALAPSLERAMSSGVMPGYIEDPGHFIKYWNHLRKDPLYDPTVAKTTDIVNRGAPISDSTQMMKDQVRAAEVCLEALREAESHLVGLDRFKRKYFMRLRKMSPFWLAAAHAQYVVRSANEAVASGDNAKALAILSEGRAKMEADFDEAESTFERLKGEPATFETWQPKLKWRQDRTWARKLFDRAEASAKVVLQPRKIGKKVKLGIVGKKGEGIKSFFDGFENVEVSFVPSLDLAELDKYDCIFVRSDAYEKGLYFNSIHAYVTHGGGGVWIEGYLCGHKRFDTRTPFPEIVETSPERVDNFKREMKFGDGRTGETMYVDYYALKPGAQGEVVATSTDGVPMAVRGSAGLGKVFFMGTISLASIANTYADETRKLFGGNAELAKEAVEYFTGVRLIEKNLIDDLGTGEVVR